MCTIVLFKLHRTLFGHVKTLYGQSKRSFRCHRSKIDNLTGKNGWKNYIFWIKTIILLLLSKYIMLCIKRKIGYFKNHTACILFFFVLCILLVPIVETFCRISNNLIKKTFV